MDSPGAGSRILYDSDCGFCRWSLGWVVRWDRAGHLEPLALQTPEAAHLLNGMPEERRMASWHLIDDGGRVHSAGRAFVPLLRLLPGGNPLAAFAARFPSAVQRAYAWTAGHRSTFGRLVPAASRARADALIARRAAPDRADVS